MNTHITIDIKRRTMDLNEVPKADEYDIEMVISDIDIETITASDRVIAHLVLQGQLLASAIWDMQEKT